MQAVRDAAIDFDRGIRNAFSLFGGGRGFPGFGDLDVLFDFCGEGEEVDGADAGEHLWAVLGGGDAGVLFPGVEGGLEMPDGGGLALRIVRCVVQGEVGGAEDFFGVIVAEVGHRFEVAEGEAQFLVGGVCGELGEQCEGLGGELVQCGGDFRGRDACGRFGGGGAFAVVADVQDAGAGHGGAVDEIFYRVEAAVIGVADAGFGEPGEVVAGPEKASDLRDDFGCDGGGGEKFSGRRLPGIERPECVQTASFGTSGS